MKERRKAPLPPKHVAGRRDFLCLFIRGGIFATLAGMLFPALTYLWPVTKSGPSSSLKEVGSMDELPVWGAKKIVVDGSVLLLIRTPDEVRAYSAICTHLGCIVGWNEQNREIVCPCHAGRFNTKGEVISGPPPRPLPSYEVTIKEGRIFLNI